MFIETLSRSGYLPRQLQLALKRKITKSNCATYFNVCREPFATSLCLRKVCLGNGKGELLSHSHELGYSSSLTEDSSQRNFHQKGNWGQLRPWLKHPLTEITRQPVSSVLLPHGNLQQAALALRFLSVRSDPRLHNYSVNLVTILQQHLSLRTG